MGSISRFGSNTVALTPRLAFAASVLFMMSADGEIAEEEVGQLLIILHNDRELLDAAWSYTENSDVDEFLEASAELLNDEQKMCIMLNLCDTIQSDGRNAPEEQELFTRFFVAWDMDDVTFRPYLNAITKKNDHTVF